MPRWVPCAECGNRYDAEAMKFCSRCGSTVQGKDPDVRVPVLANDPRRRRAQMGGAILMFMGLSFFAIWAYGLVSAGFHPEAGIDSFVGLTGDSPVPAGDLHLRVLDNGTAVANAAVAVRLPSGLDHKAGLTDAQGWYNVTLERQAAVTITVSEGNRSIERRAFIVWPNTEQVTLDFGRDGNQTDAWLGLEDFNKMAAVVVFAIGAAALLMGIGGASALALRFPNLAIVAPVPALVGTGLLFLWTILVGTFEVGILAILILQLVAIGMVASGRSSFRRPRA